MLKPCHPRHPGVVCGRCTPSPPETGGVAIVVDPYIPLVFLNTANIAVNYVVVAVVIVWMVIVHECCAMYAY